LLCLRPALEAVNLKPQEVTLTEQLIATMTQPFKPAQYHDELQDRLRKLVEARRRGQTVDVEEALKRAPVIDMMEALKKSWLRGKRRARNQKNWQPGIGNHPGSGRPVRTARIASNGEEGLYRD
jgi:DNA end-binding protein Ku